MAGPNTIEIDPERAEIEALLPWYVSGTLDREEEARVTRYLEAHPEMAPLVALTREERDETIAGNEEVGAPSRHALNRLMALIVGQGVTLGVMMGPSDPGGYTTASGGTDAPTAAGTFALVRFAPGATAAAISEMLIDMEASIVDGPKAGGIYRLRIAATVLDEAAAKARLARVLARADLVTFAALTR